MMKFWILALLPFCLWAQKTWGPFAAGGERFKVEEVISGRGVIWAMEFVSPRQIIFTERQGKLSLLQLASRQIIPISGGPAVKQLAHVGQGGLFDIKLHPQFARNQQVFITYAKRMKKGELTTVLAQAKLQGNRLGHFQQLFEAGPASSGTRHFGGRMAIKGNHLYLSVGDRGERPSAQRPNDDRGKIHRFKLDGSIPPDNPFTSTKGARKSIYSYGHRNPQGLAFHPQSGELWQHEHGPRGGDEINIIREAANYGWPVISFGKEYWGPIQVGEGTAKAGMEQPLKQYTPSIAPCGMDFYQGKLFPKWRGHLFLGSLAYAHLNLLSLAGNRITQEERLLKSLEQRVREVLAAPDGHLYISTDEGSILKLVPTK